jgi:hypothetical protein
VNYFGLSISFSNFFEGNYFTLHCSIASRNLTLAALGEWLRSAESGASRCSAVPESGCLCDSDLY